MPLQYYRIMVKNKSDIDIKESVTSCTAKYSHLSLQFLIAAQLKKKHETMTNIFSNHMAFTECDT